MIKVLCGDGSLTIYNNHYQQTYHSRYGAVTESRLVFLENSGIKKRLIKRQPCHVLEIGFGLGLNFLITAQLASKYSAPLHYTAFENRLIDASIFASLGYGEFLDCCELQNQLFHRLQDLENGVFSDVQIAKTVSLALKIKNALSIQIEPDSQHAIYLDPFSPDKNPELWSSDFLEKLFNALALHGRLCTYSVKGQIRRSLQSVGFTVWKVKGPLGKREVLIASKG